MIGSKRICGALFLGLGLVTGMNASPAGASIINTTGDISVISAPASVLPGDLQSNTVIRAFYESQVTLATPVLAEITAPGVYNSVLSLTPGIIASGTVVESYFLHSDTFFSNRVYDASITFDTQILGIFVLSPSLSLTDSTFGAPGTAYPTGTLFRGLELIPGQDYALSADMKTLTVHFFTHGNIDELRILTAVPEPSSLAMSAGVVAMAVAAGRSRMGRRARRLVA